MKSKVTTLLVGAIIGVMLGVTGIVALGLLVGKVGHSPSTCEAAPSTPSFVQEVAPSDSPRETAPSTPAFVPDVTQPEQLGVWTLSGVEAVIPTVFIVASKSVNNPLSEERLQTQMEIALRKVGIKVVDLATGRKTLNAGQLFADVRLNMLDLPSGARLYVATVQVTFHQPVRLCRNTNVLTSTQTWPYVSVDPPMILGSANLEEGIRESLDAQLNDFIKDFLTANPRTHR